MTKYLAQHDMARHLGDLGIELRNDRATMAPTIAAIRRVQDAEHQRTTNTPDGDPTTHTHNNQQWSNNRHDNPNDKLNQRPYDQTINCATTPTVLDRQHKSARRRLFTPMRVEGSPPANCLMRCRLTRGRYLDTGEAFTVMDEWTNPESAHADLGRWWMGTTTFTFKRR